MFEPTCDDAQPHPDVVGDGDVVLVHAGLAQLTGHMWAGTDTGSYCWALTGAALVLAGHSAAECFTVDQSDQFLVHAAAPCSVPVWSW